MVEACDLVLETARGAGARPSRRRAIEHRRTPMIGRTHGVHAEPMTFGLKLALWYAEVGRAVERVRRARASAVRVGKFSGAVGTFAHLDPAIEARGLRALGLAPAPVSSQVIQRDRHAELHVRARHHGRLAREVRARGPGPAEDRDRRGRGAVRQGPEGLLGDAAQAQPRSVASRCAGWRGSSAANAMAAIENVALWHERDISHSSVERVILPDSFLALDHMLRRFTRIVEGMVVHPERMRENLDRSRGVVFSGTVLLELARRGVSREQAYAWVQRNAMRVPPSGVDFQDAAAAGPGRHGGAVAGGDRALLRPPRTAPPRRRHLRPRVPGAARSAVVAG